MGMVILGEGAHFHGNFGGIEAENLADQQGICNAVGQMVESAQLVGHGAAYAREGIGEGHTRPWWLAMFSLALGALAPCS